MAQRIELQNVLETIIGTGNVYFQPPSSDSMLYPCIVYNRSKIVHRYADNNAYGLYKEYEITHIYTDPDSNISEQISMLPMIRFDRSFKADNLYHDVFTIVF